MITILREAPAAVFRFFSSIRLTVVLLFILFGLVFFGTIYEARHGLYLAQKYFFESAGQIVLWLLFFNLVAVAFHHFRYLGKEYGILLIHTGILLFFVAGFVSLHVSRETQLTLAEGDSSDVSLSPREWNLVVWESSQPAQEAFVLNTNSVRRGTVLEFGRFGFQLITHNYFPNAAAAPHSFEWGRPIQSLPAAKEPEDNRPGGIFQIAGTEHSFVLYGPDKSPFVAEHNGTKYAFQLQRASMQLPFRLKLIDFRMEKHPGTEIARTYESTVEIQGQGFSRQTIISMNEPLRYKDFTFYQASYSIDPDGAEFSTLAVVKNAGRLLPYAATYVLVLGLAVHFFLTVKRLRHP